MRVGLGLGAAYAGQPFAEKDQTGPNKIEAVLGLAAGPDGRLYVLDRCGGVGLEHHRGCWLFRRDGAYEKTIKPFPSNLPVEKAQAAGAFTNSFGGFNPLDPPAAGVGLLPGRGRPAPAGRDYGRAGSCSR